MSFQKPLHNPPFGQESYDEDALTYEQQRKTNNKKVLINSYFF
jgi:hypothetical protein